MGDVYETYSNYTKTICDENNFTDFKCNPSYTYMLEHVNETQGQEYLNCILTLTSITKDEIEKFCVLNDSIGNPNKVKYADFITVSPSSLRYIYHAHLILTHMKSIDQLNVDVIELGGGYGGLCLSIHHFAPKYGIHIKSYTICDLSNIIRLQKIYLNRVNPALNIEFVDASTFGKNIERKNMFLVSNYCFSEISKENRDSYQQILFPKITHGFMAWNSIPVYDFGFPAKVEDEIPNTGWGGPNKYVYF